MKDTGAIARKIVHAVESGSPNRRYAAPWWQWLTVPLARLAG